jgi:hypothetical protein
MEGPPSSSRRPVSMTGCGSGAGEGPPAAPVAPGRASRVALITRAGATPAAATTRGAPPSRRPAPKPTEPADSERRVELDNPLTTVLTRSAPARALAAMAGSRLRSPLVPDPATRTADGPRIARRAGSPRTPTRSNERPGNRLMERRVVMASPYGRS